MCPAHKLYRNELDGSYIYKKKANQIKFSGQIINKDERSGRPLASSHFTLIVYDTECSEP